MFYYVTKENVDYEKADPGSQLRTAGPEYEDSIDPPLFLWSQALYIIAQLLTSNLLHINELDPIRRYLPSYNRPKRPGRYSAFQVTILVRCVIHFSDKNCNHIHFFVTFLNTTLDSYDICNYLGHIIY